MKKVLIITYYWPPAGGSGVQRWLYFTKYLREFGIEPIIFAPENPAYPVEDPSLKKEIPEDLDVLKKSIIEPGQFTRLFLKKETKNLSSGIIDEVGQQSLLQKTLLSIRGNFFIPDARVLWVKPSVKFLIKYLSKENIKTVITTGPPHSVHLIGRSLKEKSGITWIADFRDPWTESSNHHQFKLNKRSERRHKKLERNVLNQADHILTTSFQTRIDFKQITTQPVHTILNGFDKAPNIETDLDKQFSLAHIGTLLADRNPVNLWEVLAELIHDNQDFKKYFKLKLVGKTSDKVLNLLDKLALTDFVDNLGYVSHQKAIALQRQSQVLLLLQMKGEKIRGIIPGKLFEYLNTKRPIIAIGPEKWDVEPILKNTHGGSCFDYNSKVEIKAQILDYFEAFMNNKLKADSKNLDQYSRRQLTKKLVSILKQ